MRSYTRRLMDDRADATESTSLMNDMFLDLRTILSVEETKNFQLSPDASPFASRDLKVGKKSISFMFIERFLRGLLSTCELGRCHCAFRLMWPISSAKTDPL